MNTYSNSNYNGEKIIIIDFGGQFTQNIAKQIRHLNVYSEIIPFHNFDKIVFDKHVKGIILGGSPCSVRDDDAPHISLEKIFNKVPILGICYGAQFIAQQHYGTVTPTEHRQYGTAPLYLTQTDKLRKNIPDQSTVLMSHGDTITDINTDIFEVIGTSDNIIAAYTLKQTKVPIYGVQFHPEVYHSKYGKDILSNFVFNICHCDKNSRTPSNFVDTTVASIKKQLGDDRCIMAVSGGVDSTVAATLIHKAIGSNLLCFFVDNGLLRQGEYEQVLKSYKDIGLNVEGIDAKQRFYDALAGISAPEEKRKVIGNLFIKIFEEKATEILPSPNDNENGMVGKGAGDEDATRLGQGTIYPDVIESVSVGAKSSMIKSHHNVGGLPETMNVKLIEPLRYLFKDDVRRVGKELGIPDTILSRHPFPGPGLAIRIIGQSITPEKVQLLQAADHIFIQGLKERKDESGNPLYKKIWQAGAILLPVQSVGVMGDERTYQSVLALRAVYSVDGMTASRVDLPYKFLSHISKTIIAKVPGINRIVYDISDKPPATIEWE